MRSRREWRDLEIGVKTTQKSKKTEVTDRPVDGQGQVDARKRRSVGNGQVEQLGNEHCVDAGCAELAHAVVVVQSCVDGIDTNGVDSELLEVGNVTLASSGICEAGRGQGEPRDVVDTYPSCRRE